MIDQGGQALCVPNTRAAEKQIVPKHQTRLGK
jgi:hypothetical protein